MTILFINGAYMSDWDEFEKLALSSLTKKSDDYNTTKDEILSALRDGILHDWALDLEVPLASKLNPENFEGMGDLDLINQFLIICGGNDVPKAQWDKSEVYNHLSFSDEVIVTDMNGKEEIEHIKNSKLVVNHNIRSVRVGIDVKKTANEVLKVTIVGTNKEADYINQTISLKEKKRKFIDISLSGLHTKCIEIVYNNQVIDTIEILKLKPNTIDDHEHVDLGLSVKWATCNVGASSPSDYGDYYAWGETETKSEYTESNSKTRGNIMGNIAGHPRYDVARAKWGGGWRMPTKAECQELVVKCTWQWTMQGGHKGYKVTSNINGKSIFLPAAGWCCGSSPNLVGADGFYWSSTPYESDTDYAYNLYFNSSYHTVVQYYRNRGRSVRPVVE